ncbi:MAG TPA: 50S ribosomal protein L21 [Patescibacteria group bacterium]|nr:50S ribosomal protein L21 [Patescibacteria group bacterium]
MYAVIRSGGKQYRVSPGDTIQVESLDQPAGATVTFDDVLAVRNDDGMIAGAAAAKARVEGTVVGDGRGKKVLVFKFKRTNQYKITRGHRQNFTAVKINEIKA